MVLELIDTPFKNIILVVFPDFQDFRKLDLTTLLYAC